MDEGWPKIKARNTKRVSPWMAIIERRENLPPGQLAGLHRDVAALPDSRLPIVRQYRPTLESFTWELPAGLVESGEDAAACCRRAGSLSSRTWRFGVSPWELV